MIENLESKKERLPGIEHEQDFEHVLELCHKLEKHDSSWSEIKQLAEDL